jgi:hypothetical protein
MFYIQEGMATFLVENSLFKVHHHFLVRESEKFRSIIMRPRSPSDDVIVLSDVTCHEFECLLGFFYNGMHEDYGPTSREWLALLSIATRFGMEKIRQAAISQIENQAFEMDPVEKILLAELHGIDGWLEPAYAKLCQRAEPLQVCEAERLGLITTVKLAQAREMHRGSVPTLATADRDTCPSPYAACKPDPPSPGTWGTALPPSQGSHSDDFGPRLSTNAEQARTIAIVRQVFWPESHVTVSPVSATLKGKKKGKK